MLLKAREEACAPQVLEAEEPHPAFDSLAVDAEVVPRRSGLLRGC